MTAQRLANNLYSGERFDSFLRRKIIGYFISPWISHNAKTFNMHPAGDSYFLMAFSYWHAHPSVYTPTTQSTEDKVIHYWRLYMRLHEGGTVQVCLVESAGQGRRHTPGTRLSSIYRLPDNLAGPSLSLLICETGTSTCSWSGVFQWEI